MAQEWELADRAEEGATDSSVRFECLWSSLYGESWDCFFNEQDWKQILPFQGTFITDVYRKQRAFGVWE